MQISKARATREGCISESSRRRKKGMNGGGDFEPAEDGRTASRQEDVTDMKSLDEREDAARIQRASNSPLN